MRHVAAEETSLPEVAAAHAEALAVQIRVLRLRRAVLKTVAHRGSTPEETEMIHQLTTLSEQERDRLIGDFLETVFGGLPVEPGFEATMVSMTPVLPDDPETAQVEAWIELAELSQDPDFRAGVRRMVEHHCAERAGRETTNPRPDLLATVRDHAEPALAAGIDPASPQADPIAAAITTAYARTIGAPDDAGLRRRLSEHLEAANDSRRERYFQLLAVVNRWPAPASLAPALDWAVRALRARVPESRCRQ